MVDYATQAANWIGRVGLFLGVETDVWNINQFIIAAKNARAWGIDTLYVKVADGANIWYGGLANFKPIHDAILAQGVGCVPYAYCYGNTYGALNAEIAILKELMASYGGVIADMEIQMNNQVSWAAQYDAALRPEAGLFFLSTWADPVQQSWVGVLNTIAPCVNAVMPQQYTDWLTDQYSQLGNLIQFPTVYIGSDMAGNNPYRNAKNIYDRGVKAISMWEYGFALANPTLVKQIVAFFKPAQASSLPTPTAPQENVHMDQAMKDTWDASQVPANKLNYGSGIAGVWKSEYKAGRQYGPPLTPEYPSVNWQGAAIVVQEFPGARIEWANGKGNIIKR
jgi:hypothetical protein